MAYLMTLFGLIIAAVVFIYTINLLDAGKRTISKINDPVTVPAGGDLTQGNQASHSQIKQVVKRNTEINTLTDAQKDLIPKRICPLCGSVLKRDEPLYAGNTFPDGKRTILIYGCQHCYRIEKESTES